jgi:hypothetical protein
MAINSAYREISLLNHHNFRKSREVCEVMEVTAWNLYPGRGTELFFSNAVCKYVSEAVLSNTLCCYVTCPLSHLHLMAAGSVWSYSCLCTKLRFLFWTSPFHILAEVLLRFPQSPDISGEQTSSHVLTPAVYIVSSSVSTISSTIWWCIFSAV